MRLAKVKRVCTAAEQLCVMDVEQSDNMVTRWVGTHDAMHPMRTLLLTQEQLQQVWELSTSMIASMEEHPVTQDPALFERVAGAIDKDGAEPLTMAHINGYWALRGGDTAVLFVREDLVRPCLGDGRIQLMLENDNAGDWWVAIYQEGVLDGLVRVADAETANRLHEIIRHMAGRHALPGMA